MGSLASRRMLEAYLYHVYVLMNTTPCRLLAPRASHPTRAHPLPAARRSLHPPCRHCAPRPQELVQTTAMAQSALATQMQTLGIAASNSSANLTALLTAFNQSTSTAALAAAAANVTLPGGIYVPPPPPPPPPPSPPNGVPPTGQPGSTSIPPSPPPPSPRGVPTPSPSPRPSSSPPPPGGDNINNGGGGGGSSGSSSTAIGVGVGVGVGGAVLLGGGAAFLALRKRKRRAEAYEVDPEAARDPAVDPVRDEDPGSPYGGPAYQPPANVAVAAAAPAIGVSGPTAAVGVTMDTGPRSGVAPPPAPGANPALREPLL
jgi:hypothetical protein